MGEAVWAGGYGQADNMGLAQGFSILYFQDINRSIGRSVALKISDTFGDIGSLILKELHLCRDIAGQLAGALGRAKNTAADALGTISIGAGKSAIYGKLDYFFSEFVF